MEVSDLVHLLPVSKRAAQLGPGHGANKVHTPLAVLHEKGIVGWDFDGKTLWVFDQSVDGA